MHFIQTKWQVMRFLCLITAIVLVFAGCGEKDTSAPQQAMGRYIEEVVALPDGLEQVYHLGTLPSGKLMLIASEKTGFSAWEMENTDWERLNAPWIDALEEINIAWVTGLTVDAEGTPYCMYTTATPEMKEMLEKGGYSEGIDIPDPILARYVDGAWQDTGFYMIYNNMTAGTFKTRTDGGVIGGYYNELVVYSPKGDILAELHSDDRMWNGFFGEADGILTYSNRNKLERYDLAAGQALPELALQQGDTEQSMEYAIGRPPQTSFCRDESTGGVCYVNKSGIYQTTEDGQLTEKVVDGALTSLVMPSVEILQLMSTEDGSFLVLVQEDRRNSLLRYRYDKSAPTVPGTALRVYSLYDTPTIRQAMGGFQRSNPNVMVRYDVGVTGEDGVSKTDALRAISTELLAGDGPDLLVLDDLPIDSYIEKGVLLDLGSIEGDLFENITGSLKKMDGKLYAVPAHFKLPLLLSEPDAVQKVQTPVALADYLETQKNPRIKFTPEDIFPMLYRYYRSRWYQTNGKLDTAVLAEDMVAIARIRKQLEQLPGPSGGEIGYDMITNGLLWKEGYLNLYIGSLFALNNMGGPYTAMKERDGALTLYPAEEKAFIPTVMLGINAGGRQVELARELIDFLLSKEQQSFELGDGLPVNRAAFDAILDTRPPDERYMTYGMTGFDPETGEEAFFIADTYWPDKACRLELLSMIESVQKPLYGGDALRDVFVEAFNNYYTGQDTLENAIRALEQKVNLRLAE